MNLKARRYIEDQKKRAQARLAARLALLGDREKQSLERDAAVRRLKAMVRKSDFRLASIAAQEKRTVDLAKAKADKLAAAQAAIGAPEPAPEKKEKKPKKQEKQAKPEKQAQAQGEGKKEKKEKKPKKEEKAEEPKA